MESITPEVEKRNAWSCDRVAEGEAVDVASRSCGARILFVRADNLWASLPVRLHQGDTVGLRNWVGGALAIGVLVACDGTNSPPNAGTESGPPPSASIGSPTPAFSVGTIGGDSARVGGPARQPVTLVNVWATWCGPCKAEFPELQTLHTTYAPKGLRVLAISIDIDSDTLVAASAKSMGATFPIGLDPNDEIRGRFAAVGIPESWLISSDGVLLWKHTGAIPAGDPAIRAAIERALNSAQ